MAQQYMSTHTGVDPAMVARANEMLDKSYQILTSFECTEGGFEWFGQGKGHESLTAYGVLQFQDMSEVYPVDEDLLKRTREWLRSRRNDKGGFDVNPRFLHDWGCPQYVADAYIVWSLTESGDTDLKEQLDTLVKDAEGRDDPYYNGLVALSLFNLDRDAEALKLLERIGKHQQDDGCVIDSKTTVVNSHGDALRIETTSVAALAWLRAKGKYAGFVEKSMNWLTTRCQDGAYGSTQSTVLALKAIVAYDASRATPKADGTLELVVDGKSIELIPFTKDRKGDIELSDFSYLLTPGEHRIELRMIDGSPMPFSVDVKFYSTKPSNDPECELDIDVSLGSTEVKEGEGTEVNVKLTNKNAEAGQTMAMAIVGLPGGLEARVEKLKELVKSGTVNAWELRGRNVVFYFTQLQPGEVTEFSFDVIAAIPGEYTGQASQTYAYYTDEYRKFVDGLKVNITPRQ